MASSGIDLRSLEELQRRLARLAMRIENIGVANKAVSAALYGFVIRNIDSEGGLTPRGWPALQPSTIREKRRIGKEKKLVRTGRLRGSFVPFSSPETAGVRSDLDYASFHDDGAPPNLPQRKITPTPEQAGAIAVEVYQRYIDRQLLDQRFNFTGTRAKSGFDISGLQTVSQASAGSAGGGGGGGSASKKKKRKKIQGSKKK